ncbi:inositol 2-dehydrogenase [Kordiimonas aestuarii]|uniref:inositol 2-dehydrogenase n=1 Tax=Kordiimonas aestuarii TaxID=1005925 RepID=UPI0021D05FBF|nr:inositol 2-dehydrogenase [Kordiimonas aestuarii]
MTHGICLIGAGRIGCIHAANIAATDGLELTYIVDPVAEAAARLAGQCGGRITDLETALKDKSVAGIVIASATSTHADLIEQAAKAGKAIFCEKPVALDVARTEMAIAGADAADVPLLLGFNRRYDPDFSALKRRIDDGTIGNVELVQITSRDPSPPPVSYIKTSGGLFKDMMIHDLDMARWLLGEEPAFVSAQASCLVDPEIAKAGDIDSALVTLRTSSGKLCQISNSRRAVYGYDQRIEVHGSGGLVSAGNRLESSVRINTGAGETDDKIQHFFLERYAAAYRHEILHFRDILDGGTSPLTSGADGHRALVLAEAAARSYKEGTTIAVG